MRILVLAMLACGVLTGWPAAAQSGKPIVAVVEMRDLANSGQSETLSTMIETAVASTGKFRLIERQNLNKLLAEQTRAKSGIVTTNRPGKVGGFEGVDFLIYGTITSLSATNKADIGTSLLAGLLSKRGEQAPQCNNMVATLSLDIKITDADSGEIRYVTRINETQKSAAACGQQGQVNGSLLFRAAADRIASGLVITIYPIQIAAVQGDGLIVLNYGEGSVAPGMILAVFAKGAVIRDPQTGEAIGSDETKLGFIQVKEVIGRMSKAAAVSAFGSPPPIGSVVRPASTEDIKILRKGKRK